MSASSNQPNNTLYINNLNDKVSKGELKIQLLALFTTYGQVLDIIASKSQKMRGQAFLVFTDLASATSAMRACEGMMFYDKPLVSIYITRSDLVHNNFFSTSIMRRQSHIQHFETKIPTLCLRPQLMPLHSSHKTENDQEMVTQRQIEQVNERRLLVMIQMKKWKLKTRKKLHRKKIHVRHVIPDQKRDIHQYSFSKQARLPLYLHMCSSPRRGYYVRIYPRR